MVMLDGTLCEGNPFYSRLFQFHTEDDDSDDTRPSFASLSCSIDCKINWAYAPTRFSMLNNAPIQPLYLNVTRCESLVLNKTLQETSTW